MQLYSFSLWKYILWVRVLFICGWLVVTIITKYHKLGGFHHRNVFLTVLSLEFQDQGFWQIQFLLKLPFKLCQWPWPSHGVLTWTLLCIHPWCLLHLLKGQQSYWVRTPPFWPHLTLTTSLKTCLQIQPPGGLGFQRMNSGEAIIVQSIMVNNFCFCFNSIF